MTLFEVNDMGSGLSMTSVNKIKELAEQREYELALEILDSQDLSKSLNPQFLRVCGDIYTKNGRYIDARKILIMAHRLAPEGKRVIFTLVQLYLLMGYRDLAKQYYDIYMFDADEGNEETNQIKYIYSKACNEGYEDIESLLHPYYLHNLDYDWSFETFLLLMKNGKNKEAEILASDFHATYKNSEYSRVIDDIQNGKTDVDKYFDIYPTQKVEDDDPEQEELRKEEAKLLEADDLRINPREAEITIMVDDYEEVEIGTKRKLKKFLKEQEKLKKEEAMAESDKDEATGDVESDEDVSELDADAVDGETEKVKAKGLFKKVFSKKKKVDETVTEEAEEKTTDEATQASEEQETVDDTTEVDTEAIVEENKEEVVEETVVEQSTDTDITVDTADDTEKIEEVSASEESDADVESEDSDKDEVQMREIHTNKHNPIISVDIDDNDFAAESDTIEGLRDDEFSNPFDSISALKKDNDEPTFIQKRKTEFVFDDIDLSEDTEDEEFDVDDFSSTEDDGFGEMKSYVEDISYERESEVEVEAETDVEIEVETETEEEVYEEEIPAELEVEAEVETEVEIEVEADAEEEVYEEEIPAEPEVEAEVETEVEIEVEAENEIEVEADAEEEVYEEEIPTEPEVEAEIEAEVETEVEVEIEAETEVEEEVYEEEIPAEPEVEAEIENEVEVEIEAETEVEEEVYEEEIPNEPEVEVEIEDETEVEEEVYEEEIPAEPEVEAEIETETEVEIEVETETEEEVYEEEIPTEPEVEVEIETEVEVYEEMQKEAEAPKKSIDFPVFRSSLFPNYNKKVSTVENNFQEIMTAGKDKIQESLLKEEQMQREAEALLASLGIDLGSITVTSNSIESINETLYDEPSRDELKSSLKIDSVKKNILRKLKEHR